MASTALSERHVRNECRLCSEPVACLDHADLSAGVLRGTAAMACMSQLQHDCAQRAAPDPASYKHKFHTAVISFARHRRATYGRGRASLKVADSAQSVGSQNTVSPSERDFQHWWHDANVKASLLPANFEGAAKAVIVMPEAAATAYLS